MKYPITRIFVVNPPVLGKKRRKIFEKQFGRWPRRPPPIFYGGVNKNHLDLTAGSRYEHLIIDDRSRWVRLKLRLGWERRAEDFVCEYEPMLREAGWVSEPVEIGRVANALSQIRIWQACKDLPDDELCMIVEDDALINPEIPFDGIEWPEAEGLLHLWPGGIGFYEEYSDDYVRVSQKWKKGVGANWTSLGYVIAPACARRFLSKLVPYIVGRTVDMEILYRGTPYVFATKKPWVRPTWSPSLVAQPPKLRSLAGGVLHGLWFLLPRSFRRRRPAMFEERDLRRRFDRPRLG